MKELLWFLGSISLFILFIYLVITIRYPGRFELRRIATMRLYNYVVKKYALHIDDSDFFAGGAIAVDNYKRVLLIILMRRNRRQFYLIPMEQIADCRIKRISQLKKNGEEKSSVDLKEISIQLLLKNNGSLSLPVYRQQRDKRLPDNDYSGKAIKWQWLIDVDANLTS